MGRQNDNDPTVVSSSIALLQERFKELQRVRERRQEKELLKLFSHEPNKSSSHPEAMVLPHRPPPPPPLQDSQLSLGLNLQTRHGDFRAVKSPPRLWNNNGSSSRNLDNSDVDTSLHL